MIMRRAGAEGAFSLRISSTTGRRITTRNSRDAALQNHSGNDRREYLTPPVPHGGSLNCRRLRWEHSPPRQRLVEPHGPARDGGTLQSCDQHRRRQDLRCDHKQLSTRLKMLCGRQTCASRRDPARVPLPSRVRSFVFAGARFKLARSCTGWCSGAGRYGPENALAIAALCARVSLLLIRGPSRHERRIHCIGLRAGRGCAEEARRIITGDELFSMSCDRPHWREQAPGCAALSNAIEQVSR